MNAGETFHGRNPRLQSPKKHLWIAITDPDAVGQQVIVAVTTQADYKDQTCVINAGDHPAVTHESVIQYADAVIASASAISKAARAGAIELDVAFSEQELGEIRAGALTSIHTPLKVREFLG